MCRLITAEGGLENINLSNYSIQEDLEYLIYRFRNFASILGDNDVSELIECVVRRESDDKIKHII